MNSHIAYSMLLRSAAEKLNCRSDSHQMRSLSQLVGRIHGRLSRPPRVVLLGEVNAGKSSLANLLIGEPVVPTSVIANTRYPLRFHYAERPQLVAVLQGGGREQFAWSEIDDVSRHPIKRLDVGLAIDRLKIFEVIDLPGLGNPTADPSTFTHHYSLGHLAIWCTVATQAWKESERRAWTRISGARQASALLAVTHMDLLSTADDRQKVLDRLNTEVGTLFRRIVSLDVPQAFESSLLTTHSTEHSNWVTSGGANLEETLVDALSNVAGGRVSSAKNALRRAFVRKGISVDVTAVPRERAPPMEVNSEVAFIANLLSSGNLLDRSSQALSKP